MAKKNIQLILNQTTQHLGEVGDLINVSPGYARNYLLPKKIAETISLSRIRYIQKIRNNSIRLKEEKIIQMNQMKSQIESINKFSIKRKVSDNNNIFGSIIEKDILQILQETTGTYLEKSQVKLPEIKEVGLYIVSIELMDNLSVDIQLQVLPETLS
uniref:ribosomal protein L9 n=1 Tax=Rhodochorton tenue TaxID=173034 RepID=UPI002A83304E|nr:ribosomal protein L9 [Rhodochorton tenue]WOK79425.1 ribosomal protein L9 [Rhodochorton tenue]